MKYPLYNDELCPDLWDKDGESWKMKADVREALLKIAMDFVNIDMKEEMKIKMTPVDIILIGSSTNYNWTEFSDLDLHILVDYDELKGVDSKHATILLTAIKINWNKYHNIQIKGHDVEIYVQGTEQEAESISIFSVKDDKWLQAPEKERPKFNKKLIKKKHTKFKEEIDSVLRKPDDEKIRKILGKLYTFRQSGLDKKGEFSEENLVFKILRSQGYLDRLKEVAIEVYDQEMTLKEHTGNLSLKALVDKKFQ
jgi:predicted nucleotidyltransferase